MFISLLSNYYTSNYNLRENISLYICYDHNNSFSYCSLMSQLFINDPQHRASVWVKLFRLLILVIGWPSGVQLVWTGTRKDRNYKSMKPPTYSNPEFPLAISSIVVSEYISTGQLYLGVVTLIQYNVRAGCGNYQYYLHFPNDSEEVLGKSGSWTFH